LTAVNPIAAKSSNASSKTSLDLSTRPLRLQYGMGLAAIRRLRHVGRLPWLSNGWLMTISLDGRYAPRHGIGRYLIGESRDGPMLIILADWTDPYSGTDLVPMLRPVGGPADPLGPLNPLRA
jgi:hypothetical protein